MQRKLKGLLGLIEQAGNKLPHPITLFIVLSGLVLLLSFIGELFGWSVTYDAIDRRTFEIIRGQQVAVRSLLNAEGIRYIFTSAVGNFTSFAPLGVTLVAMLGIGVGEGSGMIGAALKRIVLATPKSIISYVVVFTGVMSNIASDAGYVVLVPLGAIIFLSFNRHPLAGLAAAFAGVSGGFSANLIIGTIDPLLGGISTEAAQIIDPTYNVLPTANWFFMVTSAFLITALGGFITDRFVEPRLGPYKGGAVEVPEEMNRLSDAERRGLKFSNITLLVLLGLYALMVIPQKGILHNADLSATALSFGISRSEVTWVQTFIRSPFLSTIVGTISIFFALTGIAFGFGSGNFKNNEDVVQTMITSVRGMAAYIILAFFAAQFISYFDETNLGIFISVKGADFLRSTGFQGISLILSFVIVSAFINIFIGSASAKWAIMAPIFVPMMMQGAGYTPEFIQLAYRIGDSTTNIITPLMPYYTVILAFAQKYDTPGKKPMGVGTLSSLMLPYSVIFLVGWSILLVIWYLFSLPLGPGISIFL